jgi:subtilisin-like proprotein convertase family protein
MGLNGNVVDISQADHVIIPDWDIGTTEGGSSGSPLFNNQRQVVGQLHGGAAACGNNAYDTYGWFYSSWEGGGSVNNALKYWLDPDDTGVTSFDGREWEACNFSVDGTPSAVELCAPTDTVFQISVSENFGMDVTLTVTTDIPGIDILVLSNNPVAPGGSTELSLSVESTVPSGTYTIDISGTDSTETAMSSIEVVVFASTPAAPVLMTPPNAEEGTSNIPQFSWDVIPDATEYTLEIATDIDFTNIIETVNGISTNTYSGTMLDILTTYYWRVHASNICGTGDLSEVFSFTTAEILCSIDISTDVPVTIPSSGTPTVISTLEIANSGPITNISVENVDIAHTWVGDLLITIESPSGTVITLLDQPGVPGSQFGCQEDNILVTFDDGAILTSDDLENTCEAGGPLAIEGTFQPVQSLSAFANEPATGTWTLSVTDNVNQDGGVINGWGLNICSVVLPDYSLTPSISESTFCFGDSTTFQLYLGSDFDSTGINLAASGNPVGSIVNFSNNPALPGDTVEVTISNVMAPGSFTVNLNADDGTNMSGTEVNINVIDTPGDVSLSSPVDGEIDVILMPTLSWVAATYATSYTVELSDDIDFSNIIASNTQAATSFTTPILNEEQTYFWRVSAENDCGMTISQEFSFTAVGDLSFVADPTEADACLGDNIVFSLSVGSGFNDTGTALSYTITPSATFGFDYNIPDPDNVTPGTVVEATLNGVAQPGGYTIEFLVDDGTHSETASIVLNLEAPPSITTLQNPANGESGVLLNPTLTWSAVANANDYLVEIASDDLFNNIIEDATITSTTYNVVTTLDEGTVYYWRVSAQNQCGGSLSQAFSFLTLIIDGVDELNNVAVKIQPNPTDGKVHIQFSEALPGNLRIEVYAINGQQILQLNPGGFQTDIEISLDDYSNGIYLLRLIHADAVLSKKIVLQR